MWILTGNVKSIPQMDHFQVTHDVRCALEHSGFVGWQEMEPKRYVGVIENNTSKGQVTYAPHMPNNVGVNIGTPITYRDDATWQDIERGHFLLHKGRPGLSLRYVTWVRLQNRKSGHQVIINNAWYVPNGYNGVKLEGPRKEWDEGNKQHRIQIQNWVNKGYPIIGVGDYNRRNFPVVGTEYKVSGQTRRRKVRYLTPADGLEYIWIINGKSVKIEIGQPLVKIGVEKLYTDHPFYAANLRLRKR